MADEFEHDPYDPTVAPPEPPPETASDAAKQLRARQDAYRRLFAGHPAKGDVETVMSDLQLFCRAGRTAWHDNERIHSLLTGRQEVYLRIEQYLTMDFETLFALRK